MNIKNSNLLLFREFATQDERNTIWCNSYEESAERFSTTHSSEENTTNRFSNQNSKTSNSLAASRMTFEHEKENQIVFNDKPTVTTNPIQHISSEFRSSVDMSLQIEDREKLFLKKLVNLSINDNTSNLSINVQPREKIIFQTEIDPIASRFPANFVRKLKQYDEMDMSVSSFFSSGKMISKVPVPVLPINPLLNDTNDMNISTLDDDLPKQLFKVPRNRRTIHFEQNNDILEETTVRPETAAMLECSQMTLIAQDGKFMQVIR
jgi:hypothetical protein